MDIKQSRHDPVEAGREQIYKKLNSKYRGFVHIMRITSDRDIRISFSKIPNTKLKRLLITPQHESVALYKFCDTWILFDVFSELSVSGTTYITVSGSSKRAINEVVELLEKIGIESELKEFLLRY
jgi:hypothetical protein